MPRAIPFSLYVPPDIQPYLDSILDGQKAKTIWEAVRASPEFKKFNAEE